MKPETKEIKERFATANDITKVVLVSKQLKKEGFPIEVVNKYATMRKKELVNKPSKAYKTLPKKVIPVGNDSKFTSLQIVIESKSFNNPVIKMRQDGSLVL